MSPHQHDTAPVTGLRGIGDTSWQPRAACYGMDPAEADELFFPGPRDHEAAAEATALCATCPVRGDCLNFALENALGDGIWGGLLPAERRQYDLSRRVDYQRVAAVFNGRDVHLTEAERQLVTDHAYARGWRPDRLAVALKVGPKHARDLLRQAELRIADRDRTAGIPRQRKRRGTGTPHSPAGAPSPAPGTPYGKAA
jgi:hypothetical protein